MTSLRAQTLAMLSALSVTMGLGLATATIISTDINRLGNRPAVSHIESSGFTCNWRTCRIFRKANRNIHDAAAQSRAMATLAASVSN
ncbi:MAG: hypothetical protein KDI55_00250 [Anaerolineae bacterium]|nr:hypothetical protein [Anaerolineae bacterium]